MLHRISFAGLFVWSATALAVAQLPAGFQDNVALGGVGFTDAVAVRFAPDGRVFVAERGGVIKTFDDLNDTTPTVFADLSTNVYNAWDRGLLGMAIDPAWPAEPYVYVFYTYDAQIGGTPPLWNDGCPDPPGFTGQGCVVSSRLSRLEAAGAVMTGSEQVLREGWCQQYPSHSVGDLQFGQDGALYLTHGDGAHFNYADIGQGGNVCNDPVDEGGALRCQDLAAPGDPLDYHGCLLRLDPDTGAALPDNPLAGDGFADDDPIIAYGLRNPFRFTIRPGTNEVWIGDVGWIGFEEVNRVVDPTASGVINFGWPCYEGSVVQSGYDALDVPLCENLYASGLVENPYYEYQNTGNSISGLAFYDGGPYPSEYDGALFLADFSASWIRVLLPDAQGEPDPDRLFTFSTGVTPVDLTYGPDGLLYYLAYDRSGDSFVRRIDYFPVNTPPAVSVVANPTSGQAPLVVDFDASGSTDADPNDTLSFAWDLDADGDFDDATGATAQYTYTAAGPVLARVRVTDSRGASALGSVLITVDNRAPVPVINQPTAGTTWRVGDTINFSGGAVDPDEGVLPGASLTWQIILHHCEEVEHDHGDHDHGDDHGHGDHGDPNEVEFSCHNHSVQNFSGIGAGSFTAIDHEYPSYLEIKLIAADNGAPGWWDTDWSHRMQLTIDNAASSEPFADFPVLVRLDATRIDYSLVQPDGSDLRFTSPVGELLDHEIEVWNPGGESLVWVRLPSISAGLNNEFFWMYLGNPSASDTQNAGGVWTADYGAVWHMNETPAGGGSIGVNGGFENGLDGWFADGSVFASTIDPRSGSGHLKMYGRFNGSLNVSYALQDIPAAAGETIVLQSYTEHITGDSLVGTSNFVTQKIEFFDASFNKLDEQEVAVLDGSTPTDVWIQAPSIVRVAPAGTTTARAILAFIQPGFDPGAVFFDDVFFGVPGGSQFDFADATGQGNGGTDFSTLATSGVLGAARTFGPGRSIRVNSSASLELDNEATLQAWIRSGDVNLDGPARILSKKVGWDSESGYEMEYDSGNNNFTVLGSGGNFGRATPVDLDANWHLLTATMSTGLAQMYVDGIPVTTDATVSSLTAGGELFWMGQHGGGGNYFTGDIDEVRISQVARSAAWVAAQYRSMTDAMLTYGTPQTRNPLVAETSIELQPETSTLGLWTIPEGLDLVIYGEAETAPFWAEAIVLGETTMSAPSPQVLDGERYEFVSWDNGGAQTQLLTILPGNPDYYATFVEGCGSGCDFGVNDADYDGDCDVDLTDLGIVLANFGASGVTHGAGDGDNNGLVDLSDLSMVLARFGEVCP